MRDPDMPRFADRKQAAPARDKVTHASQAIGCEAHGTRIISGVGERADDPFGLGQWRTRAFSV